MNLRTSDGPDVARWVPECMDPAHPPPSTLSSGSLYNDNDSEDSLRLRQWYAGGAWKLQPLHPWLRFYSGVLGDDLPSEVSSAEPDARKPETLWSTVMQPDTADSVPWRTLPVSVEVVIFLQLLPVGPMRSVSPAPGNALWHAMHPALVRCFQNNAAWVSHLAASLAFEPNRFPAALSEKITADSKGDASPWPCSTDMLLVMGPDAVAESLARWPAKLRSVATRELSLPSMSAPFSRLLLRHLTDGGSRVGSDFAETDFVPIHVYRYSTVLPAPGEPAVNPQLLESPCIPRIALSHPHHGASVAFVGTVIVPAGLDPRDLNVLLARWLGLVPPSQAAIAKLGESRDALCQALWKTVSDCSSSSVKSVLSVTELQKPAPDGRKKGAGRFGSILGAHDDVDCFATGDVLWVEYDDANVLRWWSAALQQLSESTPRGRTGPALAKAASRDTGQGWAPRELCNPLAVARPPTSADDFVRALKPAAHTCFSLRGASLDAPDLFQRGTDEASFEDGDAMSSQPLPLVLPCSVSRFVVVPVASASSQIRYDWLSQPWRDMADAVARFLDAYLQRCSRDVEAADSVHLDGGAFNSRDVLRAFTEGVPAGPLSEGSFAIGLRGNIPALFLPFEASLDRMLFLPDVATAVADELNRRLLLICAGLLIRRLSRMPHHGEAAKSVALVDVGSSHKRARRAGAESAGPIDNAYEAELAALEHNHMRVRLPPECTIRASHVGFYAPEPAYSLQNLARKWSLVKSVRNLHGATRDSRGALDAFSLRPPPLFGSTRPVQMAEQWLFEPRHLGFDLLSLGDTEIESAVAVQCHWVGGASSDSVCNPSRSFVLRAGANVAYDEIVRRVRVEIGTTSSTADAAAPTALRLSAYSLIYAQVALALESSETSDSLQGVAPARESFMSVGSSPETEARPADATTSGIKSSKLPPFCRPSLVCVLDKSSTLGGVVLLAGKMALARTLQETSSRYFRDEDGALVAKDKPRVLQLVLVAEPVSHDEPEFPNLLGSSKPAAAPTASDAGDSTGTSKRLKKAPHSPPPPRILPSRAARSDAAKLSTAVDLVVIDDDEEGDASASDATVAQSSRGTSKRKRTNSGRGRKPSGSGKAPPAVTLPPPGAHRVWIAVSVALPRHRPNSSADAASRASGPPPILAGRTALVCISREDTLGGVLRKAAGGLGLSSTNAVISPESFGLGPDAALPSTSEARHAMRDLLQPWPDCEIVRSTPARGKSRSGLDRSDGDADTPLESDPFDYNSDSETKAPSTSTRAKRSKVSSKAVPKGDDEKYTKRLIKQGTHQQTTLNFTSGGGVQRPKPGGKSDDAWDAVQRDADQRTPSRNAVQNTYSGREKVVGAPDRIDLTSDNEDDACVMLALAASKAAVAEDDSLAAAKIASLISAAEVSSLGQEAEPLLRGRDRQPQQTAPSPAAQKLSSSAVDLVSDDSDAIAPSARPASSSKSAAKVEGRQRTGSCSSFERGCVESRQPAAASAATHNVVVGLVQKPVASCFAATPFDVQSLGRCEPLLSSPAAPARKKTLDAVSICESDGGSDDDESPAVTARASMPPPPVSLRWTLRVSAGVASNGGSAIGLQVYTLPLLLIRPRPTTPPTQGGALQGQLARLSAAASRPPGGLDMDSAAVGAKRGRVAAAGAPGAPPLPPRPLMPSDVVRAAWRLSEGITGGQALVAPDATAALLPMRVSEAGSDAAAVLQCSLAPSEITVRAALTARQPQLQLDDDGDGEAGQRSTSPVDIDAKAGSSGAASGKVQSSMSAYFSSGSKPPAGGGKGRSGGGGGGIVIS